MSLKMDCLRWATGSIVRIEFLNGMSVSGKILDADETGVILETQGGMCIQPIKKDDFYKYSIVGEVPLDQGKEMTEQEE